MQGHGGSEGEARRAGAGEEPAAARGAPADPGGNAAEVTLDQAMALAMDLQRKGHLSDAEAVYRRILDAFPQHVDALHFLGLACFLQGRAEEGVSLLARAIALQPEHAGAHNNLGNMLAKQGDLQGAEDAYRRAIELQPDRPEARTNLGVVLRRMGDEVAAEACFRKALALDPRHAEADHQLGCLLSESERWAEAMDCFHRSMILRPYDGSSYRRVGMTLYGLGRLEEARQLYQRWVQLEPDNELAAHQLAAASGLETPPARASDACVKSTFDVFAESFDRILARLEYRAPALVGEALAARLGAPAAALDILDAGVGTGLCGAFLRPYARRLTGVDLSPGMLEKAAARQLYDDLTMAELAAYLGASKNAGAFDVVVSADTLCYFGDLQAAATAAARALRPGGLLIFTVEQAAEEPRLGYQLEPHGRYSHGDAYLRRVWTEAGFSDLRLAGATLRNENHKPVAGLVVSARV